MPHVTAREAVCAITMALVRTERPENVRVMAFSGGFTEVKVRKEGGAVGGGCLEVQNSSSAVDPL
jgi:glycerate-2-kinase